MSLLYNEYIIASNNSINDNKYNAEKAAKSTSYKIKKILKPFLKMLKQKNRQNKEKKHYINKYSQSSYEETEEFWSSEIDDNSANEELESRIFNEINECQSDAAVYVYERDECEIRPVVREEKFVPVHFARTEAGTFFWTTMTKPVDQDLIQPTFCCSKFQSPELQYGDRWVQA